MSSANKKGEEEETLDARTGKVFTSAAPGKKQLVNISLARSAIDANKSFLGAISYPYTTVMIVDAVNLSVRSSNHPCYSKGDALRSQMHLHLLGHLHNVPHEL